MAYYSKVSLEAICATCEELYARDGYVKWADVAEAHGLSRQAIQLRLKAAVAKGAIPPEDVERWQSMSARQTLSRRNEEARRELEKMKIQLTLEPDNYRWLKKEKVIREARMGDLINGIITKARTAN